MKDIPSLSDWVKKHKGSTLSRYNIDELIMTHKDFKKVVQLCVILGEPIYVSAYSRKWKRKMLIKLIRDLFSK